MVSKSKLIVALLGLAAAAPAQFRIEGSLGRCLSVGLSFGASCAPPARIAADRCDDHWRRGRWETRCAQVWVEGRWEERHVGARYGWVRDRCGRAVWGVVVPARCERVFVPGRYETRTRRVFVRC